MNHPALEDPTIYGNHHMKVSINGGYPQMDGLYCIGKSQSKIDDLEVPLI
jgi:hypothetical protein